MFGPNLITVPLTVEATPDYADGDVLGGLLSVRLPGLPKPWFLNHFSINSKIALSVGIDLMIFSANPSATTFTENSAVAIHANDVGKVVDVVSIADDAWVAGGTPVVGAARNLNIPIASGLILYAAPIARGAINFGSTSDLTANFTFLAW